MTINTTTVIIENIDDAATRHFLDTLQENGFGAKVVDAPPTTKTVVIRNVPADVYDELHDSLAHEGLEVEGFDDTPMAPGSAAPVFHETGTEHWRIETLAQKLFIASQEREALTPVTEVNKLEALACFWAAANFVNVSAAIAHSYGDDGLPVGKDFDDFVASFLGEDAYEELCTKLEA